MLRNAYRSVYLSIYRKKFFWLFPLLISNVNWYLFLYAISFRGSMECPGAEYFTICWLIQSWVANIGNEPVLKVEDIIHDVLNVLKLLYLNVPRGMDGDNVNTDRSHVCSTFGASEGLHGPALTVLLECNRQFKVQLY